MPEVEVLNWEGKKTSVIAVKDFFAREVLSKPLLQEAVVWQNARRRQGDHKAKTRAEVRGGGKKPFRQKGTGSARQGSIRSPLLRGGGITHGPRKRSYDWNLPKKVRRRALKQALAWIFQQKRLIFVESMESAEGKTKELASRLKTMSWDKALLVGAESRGNFARACKNLKSFKCLPAKALNVYDVLKYDRVALTPQSLEEVYKKCGEV